MTAGQNADKETRLYGVMHAVCFRLGGQAANELLGDFGFQGFDRDSKVAAKALYRSVFMDSMGRIGPVILGLCLILLDLICPS